MKGGYMNQNKFVGYVLIIAMFLFIVAISFGYDTQLQTSLYTIVGSLWLVFGIWAAVLLLKK